MTAAIGIAEGLDPAASSGPEVSIAVAGAGLIGKRHVETIAATGRTRLHCIVDPSDAAADYAAGLGVAHFASLAEMMAAGKPDGVVLATPNRMHVEQGLECVEADLAMLVEKPVGTDVVSVLRLVEAAEARAVPVLVGHHRRHNPVIAAARTTLDAGILGRIVTVHAMCWLYKPDSYFETFWRSQPGAGPVFLNLIHDIDLLRHLCGEIVSVQALDANAVRGNPVEDSAVVLLAFERGVLGTVNVTDTVAAPWSWELTANENPDYPVTGEACYLIGGTEGSLELPNLKVWRHAGRPDWREPISADAIAFEREDPLVRQMSHFAEVVAGETAPLVSAREGLKTLAVIEAIKRSAQSGRPVRPGNPEATRTLAG